MQHLNTVLYAVDIPYTPMYSTVIIQCVTVQLLCSDLRHLLAHVAFKDQIHGHFKALNDTSARDYIGFSKNLFFRSPYFQFLGLH